MFILPYNRDNPVRRTPWVVFALMFINGVILMAEYVDGPEKWFAAHGFIATHPTLETAFSSMFLHAGFWHYAGNMFFLWMFGNRVENMFGRWLFTLAYLLSGFGSVLLYYGLDLHSSVPCVGASGAISGIVGAFLILFPTAKFDLDIYFRWMVVKTYKTHAPTAVLAWFGEQAVLGLLMSALHVSGGVAYWGHVGGFLTGVAFAGAFMLVVDKKKRRARERYESKSRLEPDSGEYTTLKL